MPPDRTVSVCCASFLPSCGTLPSRGVCLWFEQPTASGPKSARVYCGYRPGPTRVTLPSRQDDENVRAPALSRAVCVVVQVVAVGRVRWWSLNRHSCVSARTPPRPTPCGEGVGRPRRLNPSACTRQCTAVVSAVSAVFSKLTWHFRLGQLSVVTRRTPLDATDLIVQSASVESPVRSV